MRSRLTSLRAASLDDSQAADPEFERLVEQVTAQLQSGEPIDRQKLTGAHPKYAAQLRELLPAIEMLLRIGRSPAESASRNGDATPSPRQQLGDFLILGELGRGGMGVVYEAEQLSLGRRVALKVLPFAGMLDKQQLARFKNEARAAATLDHPNIVAIHFVGADRGVHFYAMQLVEGQSLAEYIASIKLGRPPSNEGIAPAAVPTHQATAEDTNRAALPTLQSGGAVFFRTAARLGIQAAEALDHAHQNGILHRDIKPANLLVDNTGKLWITDFGLARMEADAGMTMTGDLLGTLRYMSPEQALAKRAVVDHRSDIYSLGATLYELFTLQPAYGETDRAELLKRIAFDEPLAPRQVDRRIPIELETIILKAMRKAPEHRYATAQEMADDFQNFLENKPIKAKPISVMERTFRWANRNRGLVTSAAAALVIVAAVAVLASGLILRANSRTAAALQTSQENEAKARHSAAAAEVSERKTRELLYVADMALAGAAWKKNEPAQVRMVLDRYAQPETRADGSKEEDLRGFEWYFLNRQTRPQSELRFQNGKALYLIDLMPDGKEFITAGEDSVVRWHDATTGKVVRHLDAQQKEINCVSYNPSGTLFATAGDDGTVKIWNPTDLSLHCTITANEDLCFFAKFLNDDSIIAGGRGAVRRSFDASTGQLLREYFISPSVAERNAGMSDDAIVANVRNRFWTIEQGNDDPTSNGIYEWNIITGESRQLAEAVDVSKMIVDHSQKFLFVIVGHEIQVLNANSGSVIQSIQLGSPLSALAFSPNEDRLVAGDVNGQIHTWRLDSTQPTRMVALETHEVVSMQDGRIGSVEFSMDGKVLLTASRDGSVRQTRLLAAETPIRELQWLQGQACAPLPDTGLVVATKPLAIRGRSTGTLIRKVSDDPHTSVATSSDGTLIAAGGQTYIGVWNVATGKPILRFDLDREWTGRLDFSSDNKWLIAFTARDIEHRFFIDLLTGKVEKYTHPTDMETTGYGYCVEGGVVVWHTALERLFCWNMPGKTLRWESKPFERIRREFAISPNGKLVLTSGRRVLTLLDCENGAVILEVPCAYSIKSMAFLADGGTFVTGGEDGKLSLWHTRTCQRFFDIADVETQIESIQPIKHGFLVSTWRIKDGQREIAWHEF